jgi:hypothetical protein
MPICHRHSSPIPASLRRHVVCSLLLVMLSSILSMQLAAQARQASESEVQAAYLFNFGKFVKWPVAPASPTFDFCILGDGPFGTVLESTIKGEALDGKPAVSRRVSTPRDALTCRILFISRSDEALIAPILSRCRNTPVLTVSDSPEFVARGGVIQLVTESGKVRFIINTAAAERAGLYLSSELLKVAKSVQRDTRPVPKL